MAAVLRDLRARQILSPRILVLGFSTIYSLENLAAILYLVGFKNAEIEALDIVLPPLSTAQNHFKGTTFGYPFRCIRGDARSLPFKDDSFDLVATHRFFTHIRDRGKKGVWREVRRVLRRGAEFADEEIVIPERINSREYQRYFRFLGAQYPGTPAEQERAAEYMERFGGYPTFFPYKNPRELKRDIEQCGLAGDLFLSDVPVLYENVRASGYHIRARKTS